ncbi:hypothetical protein Anas_04139, partial [Armadillidium nasatum]
GGRVEGRSHDRLVLEFRGTKWTFSVASATSLNELGRALWAILKSEDALALPTPIYAQANQRNLVSNEIIRHSILGTDMLYSEELENLQRLLHFPEEVALRLTEIEYELFYNVPAIAYVRHVTTDLQANPNCHHTQEKARSVDTLIRRFKEVIFMDNSCYNILNQLTRIEKPFYHVYLGLLQKLGTWEILMHPWKYLQDLSKIC